MKIFFIILILLMGFGCADSPSYRDRMERESKPHFFTEKDGIKIFRFRGGQYGDWVYFTDKGE